MLSKESLEEFANNYYKDFYENFDNELIAQNKPKKYKEFRKRKENSTNEWYTPSKYIESVRKVLRKIEVDPASSKEANLIVKADLFYTIENSGLDKDWLNKDGEPSTVFLNPPYGGAEKIWIPKLLEQCKKGCVNRAILLVNACTERKWFKYLWQNFTLCFTDHRIQFVGGDEMDKKKNQPTNGNVFGFLCPRLHDDNLVFDQEFKKYGEIVYVEHYARTWI